MKGGKRYRIGAESGVSLSGLIVVLIVLGALALVAIKVAPAFLEYRAVKDSIVKAKAEAGTGTVREIQQAFDKNAGVNDVSSISGRDLVITRDGGTAEISFAYEKRIPLTSSISVVLAFDGTTDPSGVVAAKADTADK
jgi:hypothetical protein